MRRGPALPAHGEPRSRGYNASRLVRRGTVAAAERAAPGNLLHPDARAGAAARARAPAVRPGRESAHYRGASFPRSAAETHRTAPGGAARAGRVRRLRARAARSAGAAGEREGGEHAVRTVCG